VLRKLAELLPVNDILLSLMSQYTPDFAEGCPFTELHRRVTSFEYNSVVNVARELGFNGFIQAHSSAVRDYTPDFT
jgi:putative pyruvate formate lyase activating enzyme